MGEVGIKINGHCYNVACDDGEEPYLLSLAEHINAHVEILKVKCGEIGEFQFLLMASLMLADELFDERLRIERLQQDVEELKAGIASLENSQKEAGRREAILRILDQQAVHAACQRIESLASKVKKIRTKKDKAGSRSVCRTSLG